ncbi:MAG: glycosyltransferase family 2 protein [PVC group bacterium]|nr:glycosyltransferase family 2 protein [PVC group bacterium]
MKLSIIIPVYNEERTLRELIVKIKEADIGDLEKEIIIIDDSSDDATSQIMEGESGVISLYHTANKGKGAAIKTGLEHAKGELVLIQDGDLEYNPGEYKKLIQPIVTNKADVVYGTRFKNKTARFKTIYYLANCLLTFLTNFLYGSYLTDMETCYKLFRKDILLGLKIKASRFEFEPEVTAKLLLSGVRIHEIPISYQARNRAQGKKIKFEDGLKAVYTLMKYRVQGWKA